MPGNVVSERDTWPGPALLSVLLITAARVVLLAFNRTDLFVDEAQYWLWGQELAFGYYSKPPMIGWVIRAFTEIGGDAPFWVRLPALLFHAATALILANIAAHLAGGRAAVLVAIGYATLPMVAVGSLLISTDTIMFPFLAVALAGYLRVLDRREASIALLTGVALGLAFLSKYAAIYYVLCAGLAALALPSSRPGWRASGLILVAFLMTVSPNILWNVINGFTTLSHTLDNVDWVRDPVARAGLNGAGLAGFFVSQFAVFGPVLFGALLIAGAGWRRGDDSTRMLILFSLPIVALVCGQALLSKAYANWAASAYLAGTLVAIPWLMHRRVWLILSFGFNAALCLILPLATTVADTLTFGRDRPLLERYLDRIATSEVILQAALIEGVNTVVASNRDILADLFYTGRNRDIRVFATPTKGRAPHYYALKYPYNPSPEPVLLVIGDNDAPPCQDQARQVGKVTPRTGVYRRYPHDLYVIPGTCLGG